MEQAKYMLRRIFQDRPAVNFTINTPLALKELPACRGVLLFADSEDNPIQILTAADIRRSARARLLQNTDNEISKRRTNIAEITAKVYYLCCYNNFRTALEHYRIARELYPANYKEHIVFAAANFVTIDTVARWPAFKLKSKLTQSKTSTVFGPFPSRKSAASFIDNIEQAFRLCRNPKLLASPNKAASCPYLQIGGCCRACVDGISRAEYLDKIEKAIEAASGQHQRQIAQLEGEMTTLSGQMEFEKAQVVKKQINQLSTLSKPAYKWTGQLAQLAIVHIDKSAKIAVEKQRKREQTYSAFVIRVGQIAKLADFTIEQVDKVDQSIKDQLSQPVKAIGPEQMAEQLSLVAYFLYRNKPAGLWLNLSAGKKFPPAEEFKKLLTPPAG